MEMREGYRWRHSEIGSQPALGGCNERGAGSRGEADLLSAISRSEAFRDPVRLSPGAAGTPAACGKAGPERVRRKGAVPGYQQRRQGSRSPRSCRKCTLGRSARHRGPRLTVYAGHLTSQPPRLTCESVEVSRSRECRDLPGWYQPGGTRCCVTLDASGGLASAPIDTHYGSGTT